MCVNIWISGYISKCYSVDLFSVQILPVSF